MKKVLFLAAAATLTLASCVKNEPVVQVADQEEISFEAPVLAPNTKAVNEVGTSYENGQSFKVWAMSTPEELTDEDALTWTSDYIDGGTIVNAAGVWKGETAYYWPSTGYLNFMAVAPANVATASVGESGVLFTDYTVPAGANEDLLFSERVLNKNANNVEIQFNHALASIDFTVSSSPVTTYLKSIKVKYVKNTGTFNQGLENSASSTTPESSAWEATGEANAEYTAYQAPAETLNGFHTVTTSEDLSPGDNMTSLILLPQVFANEATAVIEVEYHQGLVPTESTTAKRFSYYLRSSEWERGVRYTYNIAFGANEILFTPSANAWVAETPGIAIQ